MFNFSIFILIILFFKNPNAITVSEKLKNVLLEGYDTSIRPVMNEKDVLTLNISMNSLTVLTLDPDQETVVFSSEFILQWQDQFLFWNMSEYNVTWIKLKADFVWTPDTVVSTSIENTPLIEASDRYINLRYDGTVRQSYYGVFTNLCDMNVDKFPYDKQNCKIAIGPWSYIIQEVQCVTGPEIGPDQNYFLGNSEWDFLRINTSIAQSFDKDVNFTYSEVHFQLHVKRRPQFYIWVLLIPTYIITVICLFGLFTPTFNQGMREERVNLGITTLLSSAVILQIVASSMPKTSELPLLGNFILAEIFVVAIGVLFSVIVLSLHHRAHTREWKPPNWILAILRFTGSRKFLTKHISRISHKTTYDRARFTGENAHLVQNLDDALTSVRDFIKEEDRDLFRELTWIKFFDRLDFLLLIIFQVGNALVTMFLVIN
ncbi:unnamed protein product [Caenorhabditis angaria]|uniref:Neurotransmitter-gated ion-channel ligand-binding domain-containing protein n=1 Tax=Caenorhabditis angaria TaxID=860376 RepID=A0A9P1INV0_9PELO|nr:unnamed protein product [Caenorhabditis angaria]